MQKSLYFICPTDCLESIINNSFQQENYFYTSLGNSFNANNKVLERIKCVIQKKHIRKICFVLSTDNKIIEDALQNQCFSNMNGLQNLYSDISEQQQNSLMISKKSNHQFMLLSYFLNQKVQELQHKLVGFTIEISAKIYDRDTDTFAPVYSNLICLKKHQLN